MPTLTAARNAVGLTFFLNGLVFSSWVSRIPEVRSSFDLTNGQLGLVLLAIAVGSVLALPTTDIRERAAFAARDMNRILDLLRDRNMP